MARPTSGYTTTDGSKVSGVTTVAKCISLSAPDGLMQWAANMSVAKQNPKAHILARDRAARVGTLTHELIESKLRDGRTVTDAFGDELDDAMVRYNGWLKWWERTSFEVVALEVSLVSDTLRYGGTFDALLRAPDGSLFLVDWKTSSQLDESLLLQLAGYVVLLDELTEYRVDYVGAIQLTKNGGFRPYIWSRKDLETPIGLFLSALHAENSRGEMKSIFADRVDIGSL